MSTKHTPGPWMLKRARELFPDSESGGFIIVKERPSVQWKGETTECFTHIAYLSTNPPGQSSGNARLLVAAPELAAALAWALGRIKLDQSAFVDSNPYRRAVELLNQVYSGDVPKAIAKATGGAK